MATRDDLDPRLAIRGFLLFLHAIRLVDESSNELGLSKNLGWFYARLQSRTVRTSQPYYITFEVYSANVSLLQRSRF